MLRNIFNVMIKYLNNTLLTRKNLHKWPLSDSSLRSFCFHSETVQHVASSCDLDIVDARFTWHQNSVLLFLSRSFSSLQNSMLCAHLLLLSSPSSIISDSLRPDLALIPPENTLHLLEFTVGF